MVEGTRTANKQSLGSPTANGTTVSNVRFSGRSTDAMARAAPLTIAST
jgi:hypothetical protein